MGGLLHLVQRGGDWAGPQPAHAPPRWTKCNSLPIYQRPVYQSPYFCTMVRCCAVLMCPLKVNSETSQYSTASEEKRRCVAGQARLTARRRLFDFLVRRLDESVPQTQCHRETEHLRHHQVHRPIVSTLTRARYKWTRQEAQLSQTGRATLRVAANFAKSLKITQGHLKLHRSVARV